uniref:Mitochondrial pyruvate carrier n=1 Tax=Magallana gigas TaxID=29159 RepID=K1PL28_MAGGI
MSSRLYQFLIRTVDKHVPPRMQPFWNHEAGPKTIFFWAPLVKWVLVGAGIGDLTRPAENVSLFQSTSMLSVNKPDFFPLVQGTAQYDLLPSAVGLGQ